VGIIIIIYVVFDLTFAGGTPTLKFVTWWYNEQPLLVVSLQNKRVALLHNTSDLNHDFNQ